MGLVREQYAELCGRNSEMRILVADFEELENLDASVIHARRLNAKEIFTPKDGAHFFLKKKKTNRRWNI